MYCLYNFVDKKNDLIINLLTTQLTASHLQCIANLTSRFEVIRSFLKCIIYQVILLIR